MTSQTLATQIIDTLRQSHGLKADEIARKLDRSRTEINQLLYGELKNRVRQDRSYRWYILDARHEPAPPTPPEDAARFANTDLARLARYYLACLGYDDAGLSAFLTSKYGDVDYAELDVLPRSPTALAESSAARKLLGRKRIERGRYGLFLGYPTAAQKIRSRRSDWEGFMVEPVLLFPIEEDRATGRLLVDLAFPIVNQKPLRAYTNADRDMIMNEVVQLEQELGLGMEDEERPPIDELAMRLRAVRPEWPWRDDIDPDRLGAENGPIAEIQEGGIYNRAVLLLAEKSPYVQGLEKELRDLASLPEAKYRETALGHWLRPISERAPVAATALPAPLLEVLPMNSEQRQAVAAALTRPLTIITGPPGTGKSQVVTNLLVTAAWLGKRVLFASKNNKAVDVVETRVNALGPRPALLRVGAQAYQGRLAEYLLALLSATTTASERDEFEEAKRVHERLADELARLSAECDETIRLRNDVDRLEQEAEDARRRLQPGVFERADEIETADPLRAIEKIEAAARKGARARASAITRVFWPLLRKGRLRATADAVSKAIPQLKKLNLEVLPCAPTEKDLERTREICANGRQAVGDIKAAAAYRDRLRALQRARPLEDIARQEAELLERIAQHASRLWVLWLRLQPSRLSAAERQRLGKYTAVLKMVIEAGLDGTLSKSAQDQYRRLMRDVSHLLPCWAVTSLSARGRIEFDPGVFDLVVFDEASQCDIASALPLLYRAKSAVVIGDPKQLSHISGLRRGQDQALMEKHGLFEDFPEWAYSSQSLFALAATKIAGNDIVSLVDHHRSHADIIGFSNKEFYEQRLRIATRYDRLKSPDRAKPGVSWIDVNGRAARPGSGGAVNFAEVKAVVATLKDLVVRKGYDGTVGVVTPFRAQANAILEGVNGDDALSKALMNCEFLVDTVHKFQGDERDVMIFSPVVAPEFPVGALGFLNSNPNLFNVAITRARAQLIVVGDRTACGQSSVGYLSRFAEYATTVGQLKEAELDGRLSELGPAYPTVSRPDQVSDWERFFYGEMYRAGLRPIPQYPVEKYLLDFLIVDGGRKLAIEVDGERYHRNWTGELSRRDQIRNQRLFELGYDVMRFWVYEVRDDTAGCLKRIKDWCAAVSPRPSAHGEAAPVASQVI